MKKLTRFFHFLTVPLFWFIVSPLWILYYGYRVFFDGKPNTFYDITGLIMWIVIPVIWIAIYRIRKYNSQ
jgi:hypothetical protein